ncbi:hypothetical protein [Halomicrobium salinisoli]|uniref:hypothetical protein n=1 Tax=Halomicrobium salinisoli TaxID=2878391 RepID=UPI001CF03BA3|nr:hypothetical protein [Halomicrobium salinisoli]
MSLTRCSRLAVALLVVALLATGVASAFSVSAEGVPSSAAAGEEVSVTYTVDDPFTDAPNEWTLNGTTELENVGWTVTVLRAGNPIDDGETTYGDQTFERDLSVDNNGDQVRIELTGEVPEVENFTYEPREQFVVASLDRVTGSNAEEFRNDTAHHYTENSSAARQAIEDAESAIESAGGHDEAENLRDSAVSAYEVGNFGNAQDLAQEAESKAESAQQSQQTMQTALMAVGALLVIALIGGGIYYWRSQGDDYSKL